jgi:uncharacterized glyoxalase superfamily protein PhnB
MRGSCLCGRVAFDVDGPLPKLYQCHCSLCRKQGGSASNTSTVVAADRLRWLRGEEAIGSWVKASGFRSDFCTTCGSPLPNPTRGGGWWVPAGLLDDDEPVEIAAQVHLGSKAAWDPAEGPGERHDAAPDEAGFRALLQADGAPSQGPAPMQPAITLLTLGVDDLERAVAFYRDGLGWPTKGIVGEDVENGAVAFFRLRSGLKLALWPRSSIAADTGLPEHPPDPTGFTLGHNLGSPAEVDAVLGQAQRAGATIVKPAQHTAWGGYAGCFQDPDGHVWEAAFNPGFAALG